LHDAADGGHKEVAELLIAKGADVNAKDYRVRTPLHLAAASGRNESAKLLIDKGADVNAKSDEGWTPLYFAPTKEIAVLLLANGADVNAKENGYTPLDVATLRNRTETADLLRKNGGKTSEELKAEGK
jgi:ankyrin repeat protein